MPKAVLKTSISFGLVTFPVAITSGTRSNGVSGTTLHKDCMKKAKRVYKCESCKATDVETVTGYARGLGLVDGSPNYVILEKDEIDALVTDKDRILRVDAVVPEDQIDPRMTDSTYLLYPEAGGEKAYQLLLLALVEKKAAAIVTFHWRKTKLAAITPYEGRLMLTILVRPEEMVGVEAIETPAVNDKEFALAIQLVETLFGDFEHGKYEDEYTKKFKQLVEEGPSAEPTLDEEQPEEISSLLEALRASVEGGQAA
jgi:DNA end-binding protein Ku